MSCLFVLSGFILVYTCAGAAMNVRRLRRARFNLFPSLSARGRVTFAIAAALGAALLCMALIERPARRLLRPVRQHEPAADKPHVRR